MMPRRLTGTIYCSSGAWYAQITVAGKRRSFALPACSTEASAEVRKTLLVQIAKRLRGHDRLLAVLDLAAKAGEGRDLDAVVRLVDAIERGEARVPVTPQTTFGQMAARWTSGELARLYPDRIPTKTNAAKDAGLLKKHVLPIIGDVPLASFTLDHADAVMRSLPPLHASGSRRQIAQLVSRVLTLAALPTKIIAVNPIPKGWIPKRGAGKALSYLYPDEDARLLGCERVPLCYRIYYGFLAREGMRSSEAEGLTWADVDLERGAVTLDANKTDDPRAWALSPGVAPALAAWRRIQRQEYGECTNVFVDADGKAFPGVHAKHRAESFRAHLLLAGVDRAALHEHSERRRPIRAHDLRATMITIALANGKTEAWVADRTGHRSSIMINGYRRAARTVAELGLGGLSSLVEAIPELARIAAGNAAAPSVTNGSEPEYPCPQGRSSRRGSWPGTAGGSPQAQQIGAYLPIRAENDGAVDQKQAPDSPSAAFQGRSPAIRGRYCRAAGPARDPELVDLAAWLLERARRGDARAVRRLAARLTRWRSTEQGVMAISFRQRTG